VHLCRRCCELQGLAHVVVHIHDVVTQHPGGQVRVHVCMCLCMCVCVCVCVCTHARVFARSHACAFATMHLMAPRFLQPPAAALCSTTTIHAALPFPKRKATAPSPAHPLQCTAHPLKPCTCTPPGQVGARSVLPQVKALRIDERPPRLRRQRGCPQPHKPAAGRDAGAGCPRRPGTCASVLGWAILSSSWRMVGPAVAPPAPGWSQRAHGPG
jgi:hypothetical protein